MEWLAKQISPVVVEIGVKEWGDKPPKHNRESILKENPSARWIGTDIEDGIDVEVVIDVQHLSQRFNKNSVGAVICSWTLEHVARPWEAAKEIALVLKPGGGVLIETHQTFPLHNYPRDYFRFSIEAVKEMFGQDIGMECIHAEYLYPAKIVPLTNDLDDHNICRLWNFEAESYLIMVAYFQKT